jgi:hypothetical protein
MITRTEELLPFVDRQTATRIVRICLFGVCFYRHERSPREKKVWLLGLLAYQGIEPS